MHLCLKLFFVIVGSIHVVPLCCWSVALLLFHLLCCLVAVVVSYAPYAAVLMARFFVVGEFAVKPDVGFPLVSCVVVGMGCVHVLCCV